MICFIALWWIGAILDASDGDLARYQKSGSLFGAWLDSFFDRIKEFSFFALLGYLLFKKSGDEIYLLLGILSIFTNIMSGYISDTKKLFLKGKRQPELKFSSKYSFGMADTRDFIIIVASASGYFQAPLWIYSTIFLGALCYQLGSFIIKYK